MKIYREAYDIEAKAFNILEIVLCESGKLDLSGTVDLEPFCYIYSPAEGSLRPAGYRVKKAYKYYYPGYYLFPYHERSG